MKEEPRSKAELRREIEELKHRVAELSPQEGEPDFRVLSEQGLLGVAVLQDDKIKYANQAMADILERPLPELVDLGLNEAGGMVHLEDRAFALAQAKKKEAGDRDAVLRHSLRLVTPSGRTKWVDNYSKTISYGGRPADFVTSMDVTEHKNAEAALRESEARLRAAIESLPFDFFIIGADGRYAMQNTVCREHWGDIIGKRPDDINTSEAVKAVWRDNNRRALAGEVVTGEVEFDIPTGRLHLFNVIAPIVHGGRVREILGVNVDITDRKLAEDALADEKERLAVTLRSIGDGVITTGVDGRAALMSQVAEDLTGWTQAEAKGRPLAEVFHLVDELSGEPRPDPAAGIIAGGPAAPGEKQSLLRARGGGERLIAHSGAPIRDREANTIGAVVVFRDITEKRRMEEELAKADKLESVGILAGGIAHDFNNILTAVLGNVSFARRLIGEGKKAAALLNEAEKACMRARDLTLQLLTFSRGGAPVRTPSSIADLVRETATFALGGSAAVCRFELDAGLYPVEVDAGQISQVINNLVINADQAMPNGGTITIRAENRVVKDGGTEVPALAPGRYVMITISDQGMGIPEQHLARIFDPFFTTKQKGSGLGLAITYSIIKKHDGGISVESQPGQGASFHIYLPASTRPPRVKGPAAEQPAEGKGRVLLMDDEESIRDLVGKVLGDIGYEVEPAREGGEAIAKYVAAMKEGRPFDAVVLDLTVKGGMGGKEAIVKLLVLDPGARAIVTSGYSTDDVMSDFRKYGFKAVLAKPFRPDQLSKVLQSVIGQEQD